MTSSVRYEPSADLEELAVAGASRAAQYRAAYEAQLAINLELSAETQRLAEEIEARFTEWWPPDPGTRRAR